MKTFAAIAFTPAVCALQETNGSRNNYARLPDVLPEGSGLGEREATFLHATDSAFLASVNVDGWPYVQHRGGPRGFIRVLSPTRIAFADFRGYRQYVSARNVTGDNRVALIVMDYANQRRLKLFGRLHFEPVESADPALIAAVELLNYRARIERVATIDVEAFDWNCPPHIIPRFTLDEIEAANSPLRERVAQLEAELAALRADRSPHELMG
ncbi:MAG: pyridoxamine 5'-phosphate oxidase family protein [Alphaproteobacteria bacterium]|nr:pyridoxamine 5'-phosphate oxidase family protein [Alphaproteobacteria bacterium]